MAMMILVVIAAVTALAMAVNGLLNQQFVYTAIDVALAIGCFILFLKFLPRKE